MVTKHPPIGSRNFDFDVEDYRGLGPEHAGERWGEDHPLLPEGCLTDPFALLMKQAALATAMYEAGAAAILLWGPDPDKISAFSKGVLAASKI